MGEMAGWSIPEGIEAPAWVAVALWAFTQLSNNKAVKKILDDVLIPSLADRGKLRNRAAERVIENTVTLDYALYTIGFHYYIIARQMVDLAIKAVADRGAADYVSAEFFRSKVAPEIQRTKRILSKAKMRDGTTIDRHIVEFTASESNIGEFYRPIVESIKQGCTAEQVRERTLLQFDKFYDSAEQFFLEITDNKKK